MAEDYKYQSNFRILTQLHNVRANDPQEYHHGLENFKDLIPTLVELETLIQAATAAQPLLQPQAPQQEAPATAPAGDIPPTSGVHSCAHGVMTQRSGTNARGAWTGYFCPLPKGDPNQCKAQFK